MVLVLACLFCAIVIIIFCCVGNKKRSDKWLSSYDPNDKSMWICPDCGTVSDIRIKKCRNCGRIIKQSVSEVTTQNKKFNLNPNEIRIKFNNLPNPGIDNFIMYIISTLLIVPDILVFLYVYYYKSPDVSRQIGGSIFGVLLIVLSIFLIYVYIMNIIKLRKEKKLNIELGNINKEENDFLYLFFKAYFGLVIILVLFMFSFGIVTGILELNIFFKFMTTFVNVLEYIFKAGGILFSAYVLYVIVKGFKRK